MKFKLGVLTFRIQKIRSRLNLESILKKCFSQRFWNRLEINYVRGKKKTPELALDKEKSFPADTFAPCKTVRDEVSTSFVFLKLK